MVRSRNDAGLYTGGGSARPQSNLDKLNAERVARKKKKEDDQHKLKYASDIVNDMLDKEIKKTELELLKLIGPNTPKAAVTATLVGLNLYDGSMKTLKNKLQNMLRPSKLEGQK